MFDPKSLPDLTGQVFIVTGGNTGIGFVTCRILAAKGGKVYMTARSSEKAAKAIAEIQKSHKNAHVDSLIMDHTDLASVVSAASQFRHQETRLNGLILNAGIMNQPYSLTRNGFEIQMQTNYLAHWLFTTKLIPMLQSTARASGPGSVRIVNVTSEGHKYFGVQGIMYDLKDIEEAGPYNRYGQSKLANILHAKTLHSQYGPGSDSAKSGEGELWVAAVHPGFANTQMNEHNRDAAPWYLSWIHRLLVLLGIITPWERACISSTFVAASPDFTASMSGQYFYDAADLREPSKEAQDITERLRLEKWTVDEMAHRGFVS